MWKEVADGTLFVDIVPSMLTLKPEKKHIPDGLWRFLFALPFDMGLTEPPVTYISGFSPMSSWTGPR